jgi:UDP-glucose 4-epimerase
VAGTDGVFHLAALGSVPRSVADPTGTHVVNTTGSLNILVACRDLGVKRVVYAGSSSVYGALEELPKREDHPTHPISPYGLSKLVGEEYCRIFSGLYGMEAVTLRFYNVFGPRQNPAGPYAAVIPIWVSRLLAGEPPLVEGDGGQTRDFTYVANVVDANVLAMTAASERVRPGLFNVAAGGRISLNTLLEALQESLGTRVSVEHGPPRPGDIRDSQADISRIREHLGYEPRVSFAEGIRLTTEYFRKVAEAA